MGYLGTWGNFNIFVSNNVAHSNLVTVSSLAAADTLTIMVYYYFRCCTIYLGECKPTAAALIGMINGVMGTAGDYVEFDAADRAKLLSVNAKAVANGSDVEIVTAGHVAYSQSGVTLGGEIALLGWTIWMFWYGYPKRCCSSEQRTKKDRLSTIFAGLCTELKTFTEGAKKMY